MENSSSSQEGSKTHTVRSPTVKCILPLLVSKYMVRGLFINYPIGSLAPALDLRNNTISAGEIDCTFNLYAMSGIINYRYG
jgi:hypothetical protein